MHFPDHKITFTFWSSFFQPQDPPILFFFSFLSFHQPPTFVSHNMSDEENETSLQSATPPPPPPLPLLPPFQPLPDTIPFELRSKTRALLCGIKQLFAQSCRLNLNVSRHYFRNLVVYEEDVDSLLQIVCDFPEINEIVFSRCTFQNEDVAAKIMTTMYNQNITKLAIMSMPLVASVERFGEALCRSNVKELAMVDNAFDDDDVMLLADAIVQCRSLEKILFVSQKTSCACLTAFVDKLVQSTIMHLEIDYITFCDHSLDTIRNLCSWTNLTTLSLNNARFAPQAFRLFLDSLPFAPALKSLSLTCNELKHVDLGDVFRSVRMCKTLKLIWVKFYSVCEWPAMCEEIAANCVIRNLIIRTVTPMSVADIYLFKRVALKTHGTLRTIVFEFDGIDNLSQQAIATVFRTRINALRCKSSRILVALCSVRVISRLGVTSTIPRLLPFDMFRMVKSMCGW